MCVCRDHPRVCGEKRRSCWFHGVPWGSPPRVRGKAAGGDSFQPRRGITPACAGKSFFMPAKYSRQKDHPRVCGEKGSLTTLVAPDLGSPPRVRGKGHDQVRRRGCAGITPACAGKSSRPLASRTAGWDHPRVCGEKGNHPLPLFATMGSPPRVRGKDVLLDYLVLYRGITPACAGKRLKKALKNKDF